MKTPETHPQLETELPPLPKGMTDRICLVAAVTIAVRDEFRASNVGVTTGNDHANIAIRLIEQDMYARGANLKSLSNITSGVITAAKLLSST